VTKVAFDLEVMYHGGSPLWLTLLENPDWSFKRQMAEQQQYRTEDKVNRVAKVVKGGRRFSFAALMVIGTAPARSAWLWQGQGGGLAVQKGIEEAKKACAGAPGRVDHHHPVIGEPAQGGSV